MVVKARMVAELGAGSLLLPDALADALLANDQVKYFFTLLQAAQAHADSAAGDVDNLRSEREACRVADRNFDIVVTHSRRDTEDGYLFPHAARIHRAIVACVKRMCAPLDLVAGERTAAAYRDRLRVLVQPIAVDDGRVSGDYVGRITHARRGDGDSVHILVMDLHRELHRLQSVHAQETLHGARVYGLSASDRLRVAAFMRGVNATAHLKFDHPGLGTTAMRYGGDVVIQNDIGSTDAHVVVVTVHELTVTLTYSDVHQQRARFFRDLLDGFAVEWGDVERGVCSDLQAEPDYLKIVGRFGASDQVELDRYLEHLGSRLVFLIDWNKARKRLRSFLKKADRVATLRWAADQECGHRAFLQLGGEQLVFDAIERVGHQQIPYGQRLDRVLGAPEATDFLRHVLRLTSAGLSAHRSLRFITDEIDAELLRRLQTAPDTLFTMVSEHAALVFELASGVRDTLSERNGHDRLGARASQRAVRWERRADELLSRARAHPRTSRATAGLTSAMQEADRAADRMEVAAFSLTLLDLHPDALSRPADLIDLADLVLQETQDYVRAVEAAAAASRTGSRDDLQDFLEAVDAVGECEARVDEAERVVVTAVYRDAHEYRDLHLVTSIASTLEQAGDALVGAALHLRDFVFNRSDRRMYG